MADVRRTGSSAFDPCWSFVRCAPKRARSDDVRIVPETGDAVAARSRRGPSISDQALCFLLDRTNHDGHPVLRLHPVPAARSQPSRPPRPRPSARRASRATAVRRGLSCSELAGHLLLAITPPSSGRLATILSSSRTRIGAGTRCETCHRVETTGNLDEVIQAFVSRPNLIGGHGEQLRPMRSWIERREGRLDGWKELADGGPVGHPCEVEGD